MMSLLARDHTVGSRARNETPFSSLVILTLVVASEDKNSLSRSRVEGAVESFGVSFLIESYHGAAVCQS